MQYERSASFIADFFEDRGRAAKGSLPRCAKRHKLGIQMCKRRASRQIAMLFEQATLFERSLRKAVALERVRKKVRNASTKRSLIRGARHGATLPEPTARIGDNHHALDAWRKTLRRALDTFV